MLGASVGEARIPAPTICTGGAAAALTAGTWWSPLSRRRCNRSVRRCSHLHRRHRYRDTSSRRGTAAARGVAAATTSAAATGVPRSGSSTTAPARVRGCPAPPAVPALPPAVPPAPAVGVTEYDGALPVVWTEPPRPYEPLGLDPSEPLPPVLVPGFVVTPPRFPASPAPPFRSWRRRYRHRRHRRRGSGPSRSCTRSSDCCHHRPRRRRSRLCR